MRDRGNPRREHLAGRTTLIDARQVARALVALPVGRERLADLLIALAFAAVLFSPLGALPRFVTYLLAVLALGRATLWRVSSRAPLGWAAGLLLGYLLLSLLWAEAVEPALATRMFVRAAVLACFLVALADCVRRGETHRRIGCWFAVCGGAAAVFAIAEFWLRPPEMGRLLGTGQIRNELIAAQAFTVCFLFALDGLQRRARGGSFAQNRVVVGLLVASAAASAVAVALAGARTCWLALLVGTGVLLLASRVQRPMRLLCFGALWLAVLAGLVCALVWTDGTREWLLPRGASFRPVIWQAVFSDTVANAMWFGKGLSADGHVVAAGFAFLHPHSMYLSIFHQAGVFGLALFGALLAGTAASLLRWLRSPDARLALALLAAGAVVWLFDGHQLVHKVGVVWWLFWFPVATAIGLFANRNGRARAVLPDRGRCDDGRVVGATAAGHVANAGT